MRRKTHVTRQDIPICRPHSTLTGGRSTRIRVWRGPSPRQRPPKTLSTQRPPPHSRFGRYSRTDLPSDHSNPPHRRTRQACLDRRPSPGSSPAAPLPQHPRVTHPTARTRARSPCSHLARHPPHRVLRLCTTPPLLRSSTSPPQHCTPRQACVRKHTHKRSQRAVASVCVLLSVFAWMWQLTKSPETPRAHSYSGSATRCTAARARPSAPSRQATTRTRRRPR